MKVEEDIKDKNRLISKEIIDIKKRYLDQIEKFDSKIYFIFLSASLSLILINFKIKLEIWGIKNVLFWAGLILLLCVTLGIENVLDWRRKNKFNDLIHEIKTGKFSKIK